MKKNLFIPHTVAALFMITGIAILLYLGIKEGSMQVYSVEQLLLAAKKETNLFAPEIKIQVYGSIESITKSENLLIRLKDKDAKEQTLNVYYSGVIPENLVINQNIFVDGTFEPLTKEFYATKIVTTCPAKYQTKDK